MSDPQTESPEPTDETPIPNNPSSLENLKENATPERKPRGCSPSKLPPFDFAPNGTCRRCKGALPPERLYLCEPCETDAMFLRRQVEERQAEDATDARFARSGLPLVYRPRPLRRTIERSWDTVAVSLDPGDVTAFDAFTSQPRGGLFLWGPKGTYKTSAAAALLARAIQRGEAGRFCYVPEMFTELYAIYAASDGRSRADVIDHYAYAPWLVIDDLGKEKPSEHGAAVLNELFDIRYRLARSMTIVTSNYPLSEVEARLATSAGREWAEPITRRIKELCAIMPMEPRLRLAR